MPEYKVSGSYRSDRGHEHGEPKPHKFNFTVLARDKKAARNAAELEIKRLDSKFDSLREFTAVEVPKAKAPFVPQPQ